MKKIKDIYIKKLSIIRWLVWITVGIIVSPLLSCGNKSKEGMDKDPNRIDTLKVVTLYGPTSFFNYREQPMGIDYENVRRFAQDNDMELDIKVMPNINELINALKNGEAHLAAYPVPYIAEYNSELIHCGVKEISNQVLLQKKGDDLIKDVTQLVGKEVYVEKDSKFQYRLKNLNEELGGGIEIKTLDIDTISPEDVFRMVNSDEIKYAVVDSETAALYKSSFPDLDYSLRLSADQAASWAVALGLDSLAKMIDRWENNTHSSEFIKDIYKKYYDRTFEETFDTKLSYFKNLKLKKGSSVSTFDNYFKKYAGTSGFDWRLLAAIAYCESRYNPSVESRFGAYGLMQVMPVSAKAMGEDPGSLGNPETNVRIAAKILSNLDKNLKKYIDDPDERLKFVVASYNSGIAHIYDSIALADKLGLNPDIWNGNVSVAALMKSRPEYFNDPVVKYGYFRGRETVDFVDHVTSIYNYLKTHT